MTQTLEAVFDGQVLCPQEPIELKPNTRVRVTVETLAEADEKSASFLDTAMSLNLDGPPDWSKNVDKYLYGELHNEEWGLPRHILRHRPFFIFRHA